MDPFAGVRVILYIFELLWSLAIAALAGSKAVKEYTEPNRADPFCYFGEKSTCDFVVAWSVLFLLAVLVIAVWYSLRYWTSTSLPQFVESFIFAAFIVWWFIGAVTATSTASGSLSQGSAIVAFSWMLMFFCAGSALVAYLDARKASENRSGPNPNTLDY